MELKNKEKDVSDAKVAMSKSRQEIDCLELKLQNERALRTRNEVDLAQILRQHQTLETLSAVAEMRVKPETDWSSLSPASANSLDSSEGSPEVKIETVSPSQMPADDTQTSQSQVMVLPMSVEPDLTKDVGDSLVSPECDVSTRSTPSPSNSTESSSQLVIVDS